MYDIALPIVNTAAAVLAVGAYVVSAWKVWPQDKFWSVLFGFMALICLAVAVSYAGALFAGGSQEWITGVLRPLVWVLVLFPAFYIVQHNV